MWTLWSWPGKALVAIILTGILLLTGCGSPPAEPLAMEVSGGIVLEHSAEQIRIRAVSPEVAIRLTGDSSGNSRVELRVENVPADRLTGGWTSPSSDESSRMLEMEKLSPTSVQMILDGALAEQQVNVRWDEQDLSHPLTFAVLGDNQGNDDVLARIIDGINGTDAAFLIHLGDLVPSGQEGEYDSLLEVMSVLEIPWFAVPGNHDVRGEGMAHFEQRIAPREHGFDLGGYQFLFMDTSSLNMTERQLSWLEEQLGSQRETLLFMHCPPTDPRGRSHSFLDPAMGVAFLEQVTDPDNGIRGLFTGHIHMFHHDEVAGMTRVVSGGAGARLYAAEDEGGFHHYALVTLGETLEVAAHPVEAPPRSTDLVVTGREDDLVLTREELLAMATVEREGQFQNVHGNFRSEGTYRGVPIKDLADLVGGMEPGDRLRVHSWDGYRQDFPYENVVPEAFGWYEYQGDMVLAVTYNGAGLPEWEEGYRLAFLPEDGVYDNEDLLRTSLPGEGGHVYLSAGARWVRMVNRLEVIPWNSQ
ncbi:MAG: metallophosphoesterase [Bacillota bacterium]|nr:metallophosphoesterase [Bacillota bacterium]MDW7676987.1 metallophosphoesterase [Bacillota bacterium]